MEKIRQNPVAIRNIYVKEEDGEFKKVETVHIFQQERYEELEERYGQIRQAILEERRLKVEDSDKKSKKAK